ncbi:MAG TPA: LPS export ABC transporter permease LptG [Desulfosalsimonadaceae bacterium]|nr:LPS export ABC transporter permease LptG [Desulfosalsimonadaceae bacterium]
MTIVHRYISALFFKFFAIVLFMVVVIYLCMDVFGRIDNLLEEGLTPVEMLCFFAFKVPLIISQITPVAVLLAVLVTFGIMSRNNEVLALKSSGVSLQYLLVPILVIGLLVSVALFVFSEVVVPVATIRAHQMTDKSAGGQQVMTSRESNIWLKHQRAITHIQYYHPDEDAIYGVSTLFFDSGFHLRRRLDAQKGVYRNGGWTMFSAMVQELGDPEKAPQTRYFDQKQVDLALAPADLKKIARSAEEMSFSRLRRYIAKVERDGYDATRYKVDLHAKIAFPAICLIMSMFGAALALRGRTREGMAVSFAYGIVVAFIYWSLYSLCLSLGYGGILPPVFAAWMANMVFFCTAGLMVVHLE